MKEIEYVDISTEYRTVLIRKCVRLNQTPVFCDGLDTRWLSVTWGHFHSSHYLAVIVIADPWSNSKKRSYTVLFMAHSFSNALRRMPGVHRLDGDLIDSRSIRGIIQTYLNWLFGTCRNRQILVFHSSQDSASAPIDDTHTV